MTGRRALFQQGSREAAECRESLDFDDSDPISPYDVAERLGVRIRVKALDMEGTYVAAPRPRIILSSLRPMPRRTFTAAHELGHHVFGHGMSIDAQESAYQAGRPAEEDLADAFAGHLLMPAFGIRQAFHVRGINRSTPSPKEVFAIASEYGVGYATLVQHLRWGLNEFGEDIARELLKTQPKAIRDALVGNNTLESLAWMDDYSRITTMELQVGGGLLVTGPHNHQGIALTFEKIASGARLYRATARGQSTIMRAGLLTRINVWPSKFDGDARYRALEDGDDD